MRPSGLTGFTSAVCEQVVRAVRNKHHSMALNITSVHIASRGHATAPVATRACSRSEL